jgi:hypothetical protein
LIGILCRKICNNPTNIKRLVYNNAPKQYKPMETEYKADLLKQGIATVLKPAKKIYPFVSTSKKNTKQLSDKLLITNGK